MSKFVICVLWLEFGLKSLPSSSSDSSTSVSSLILYSTKFGVVELLDCRVCSEDWEDGGLFSEDFDDSGACDSPIFRLWERVSTFDYSFLISDLKLASCSGY